MADEEKSLDARYDIIRDRIASAFPKQAGAKLTKALAADDIRYNFILTLQMSIMIYFHFYFINY